MNATWMVRAIWAAGVVHVGIMGANIPLPGRLQVRERLAGVPRFIRQIFYVHWIYIVIVLGLFAALCFGFARELAGASSLGKVSERIHGGVLAAADCAADFLL
jgi:hypothetical protein